MKGTKSGQKEKKEKEPLKGKLQLLVDEEDFAIGSSATYHGKLVQIVDRFTMNNRSFVEYTSSDTKSSIIPLSMFIRGVLNK